MQFFQYSFEFRGGINNMALFWKKNKNEKNEQPVKTPAAQTVSLSDNIRNYMDSSNGLALIDYKGMTPEEDEKVKAFAKQIGVTYRIDRKKDVMTALTGSKFERMKADLEDVMLFKMLFFDNVEQIKQFSDYINSSEITPSANGNRMIVGMLDGEYILGTE